MTWYYANEGRRVGPVDDAEFQALVEVGTITPETLVWNETLPNWAPYATLTEPSAEPQITFSQPTPQDGARCNECGRMFSQTEMIQYKGVWVCAGCKPRFIQKLREGATLPGVLEYAGFWIRLGAKFVDGLISTFLIVLGFALITVLLAALKIEAPYLFMGLFSNLFQLLSVIFGAAYSTFFLGKYGATPGKMAFGLKVVTADGDKITYARAFGRHFAEILSYLILAIGYIIAAFDEEKRTLHDRICNTRVIKK